ncbi:prepilin-type N-terminal cleavage/methylation domain-containing protein [Bradyrhizobium sp. CNPSo 4010]|uniref:Prepilin-type N-terminal cleavage/methylation domain-containing protein n=1 Tax=Bradyrhizobium agreste TaxID=2751811 RepID=A0ABS0PVQ0_9BRAD|nr:prepilin-type N-terminal cleavage/methylation domain-containing protein [Bradyrhizobium agreste]MBH5400952.1 prepilin-type N-terminal cleavage/methylation domain-containing protein [Bradyrhizobium agreste]
MIAIRSPAVLARRCLATEGFTLLEVVVSLAILSLSLGVIYHVLANALGNQSYAETVNRARLVAQGLIAKVGTDIPASAGETSGDDGHGLRWRLSRKAFGDGPGNGRAAIMAIEVSAEVFWGEGEAEKSIRLTTLRLAGGARPR